jgi:hypothetical protein
VYLATNCGVAVIISYSTGLSFASERIGPLAAIITTAFYLLALYLFVLPNTPENSFASIYSESLIKTPPSLDLAYLCRWRMPSQSLKLVANQRVF